MSNARSPRDVCSITIGTTCCSSGLMLAPRYRKSTVWHHDPLTVMAALYGWAKLTLDLDWDVPLNHRKGGETRLCGIDVYHEFEWLDVFPDERTQFKNGQCLAKFVQEKSPEGKTPALLLTLRDGVTQGFRQTSKFLVFVVNLQEYRATNGDEIGRAH